MASWYVPGEKDMDMKFWTLNNFLLVWKIGDFVPYMVSVLLWNLEYASNGFKSS